MISINNSTFHLQGKSYSYVFYISREGYLLNFHFGKRIPVRDYSADAHLLLEPYPVLRGEKMHQNLSTYPQEYPTYGHLDMRAPALELINGFGNCITVLIARVAISICARTVSKWASPGSTVAMRSM